MTGSDCQAKICIFQNFKRTICVTLGLRKLTTKLLNVSVDNKNSKMYFILLYDSVTSYACSKLMQLYQKLILLTFSNS